MSVVQVDTHVAVWMYVAPKRLEPAARHLLGKQVALSPMALLELQYLAELGRLTVPAGQVLDFLRENAGVTVADTPWPAVARTAMGLTWTRDPFDRLIAAYALTDGVRLVTADRHLRRHCRNDMWT